MDTGIKSVWGKCNNVDVVFTKNDRGLWDVAVPAPENFIYILEIWAEDNAGNRGYIATIRVTISRDSLHVSSIEIIKFGDNFSVEAMSEIFGNVFKSDRLQSDLSSENINSSLSKHEALRTEFK